MCTYHRRRPNLHNDHSYWFPSRYGDSQRWNPQYHGTPRYPAVLDRNLLQTLRHRLLQLQNWRDVYFIVFALSYFLLHVCIIWQLYWSFTTIYSSYIYLYIHKEKGRDLTQSYDKSPYTNRILDDCKELLQIQSHFHKHTNLIYFLTINLSDISEKSYYFHYEGHYVDHLYQKVLIS